MYSGISLIAKCTFIIANGSMVNEKLWFYTYIYINVLLLPITLFMLNDIAQLNNFVFKSSF